GFQRRETLRRTEVLSVAEEIVKFNPDAQLPERAAVFFVGRKDKPERIPEMRGDIAENFLLQARFAHESDAALFQITETAVEQAAGAGTRAIGEIVTVDQGGAQTAHGSIAGD